MARRKSKIKPLNITQQFNRYAQGLTFLGLETKEKKRATRKQLKDIQKAYRKFRQKLRENEPSITLPTIAQISKYLKETIKEKTSPVSKPTEELEPLDYADREIAKEYVPSDFPILLQFQDRVQDAMDDCVRRFGDPKWSIASSIRIEALTEVNEKFLSCLGVVNLEDFANWLANSAEWERFNSMIFRDSDDDSLQIIGEMIDALQGILADYKAYSPQTNSTSDNI